MQFSDYTGDGNYCDGYDGYGRHRRVGRPKRVNALAYARYHKKKPARKHKPFALHMNDMKKKGSGKYKSKFVYLKDLQNIARKHGIRGFTVMGKKALHHQLQMMGLVH